MGWVLIVVMYLVTGIVVTYFQAGLVLGANERLDGRDATVGRRALRRAATSSRRSRAGRSSPPPCRSSSRRSRNGRGSSARSSPGCSVPAWRIVTFLAIPVVALEAKGPFTSLKRSGTLLKCTWGENLGAPARASACSASWRCCPGCCFIGLAVAQRHSGRGQCRSAWSAWCCSSIAAVIVSAMTGIYKTALYRYAVDGKAPAGFAESDLADAFVRRSA